MSTYEISKSSLLSLKAEILRKQDELSKAKIQNKIKKAQPKKPLEVKNKGVEHRTLEDGNEEDEDLLKKSRSVLESKAKLYDKLSKRSNFTDEETERNRRFLVRFDKKNFRNNDLAPDDSDDAIDVDKFAESDEEQHFSDEYEPPKNPDEEWVEYTDCLGRTRKCMRKDLEFVKSKDADLRGSVDKNENKEQLFKPESNPQEQDVESEDRHSEEFNEQSELLSSDMRRELLRQQWEKEEDELRKKNDIHYQDILFSEARTHGVGYYGFSKDEEERAKQQEALKNLRQETQQQQKKAQELRSLREKQLAARAKAARNRKRARMGLPPEEDEPEVVPQPEEEKPNEQQEKQETEEEQKEKEKETARQRHIRPWDIGKEGVKVKQHYEHTQEEWVDKKRKERPKEFAPPSLYSRGFRSEPKDKDEDSELDKTLFFSTKKNLKDKQKLNRKKQDQNAEDLFFIDTSRPPPNIKARGHINPYKTKESFDYKQNSSTSFDTTPIVNECEDFDDEQDRLLNDFKSTQQNSEGIINSLESDSETDDHRGKGPEIAPPPTFDYYGPSDVKKSKPSHSKGNLEDSISAGLQFLRRQAEKKDTSTKHPSEMFLL